MSDDLRALSEAATPAPWSISSMRIGVNIEHTEYKDCPYKAHVVARIPYRATVVADADAALIVALRNAYASGDLITREEAEQMVADALARHDERLHEAAKAWARFKEDEYVDPDRGVIDGSDYAEPNIVQLFDLLFGTAE